MVVFETERLVLRYFNTGDAAFFMQLVNSPGWLKYIGDRNVHNAEASEAYLLNGPIKSYEENGFGSFCVVLKETGTAIGSCGLIKRPGLEGIDIGFAFLPEYEGKGYGYESAKATIDYGKTVLGIDRILGITVPYNTSSIKLLEKLGLKFEKMITMPNDNEELMLYASS